MTQSRPFNPPPPLLGTWDSTWTRKTNTCDLTWDMMTRMTRLCSFSFFGLVVCCLAVSIWLGWEGHIFVIGRKLKKLLWSLFVRLYVFHWIFINAFEWFLHFLNRLDWNMVWTHVRSKSAVSARWCSFCTWNSFFSPLPLIKSLPLTNTLSFLLRKTRYCRKSKMTWDLLEVQTKLEHWNHLQEFCKEDTDST